MAEGKVDRAEEFVGADKAAAEAASAGKAALSLGHTEEKVPLGFLGESKDQPFSENSIPLSPQWLYVKPTDSKDGRPQNSSSHGSSPDSAQKDAWRLDGSQDKKERRRNAPDIENTRRWREEERETSLLGRKERKNERRNGNNTSRESSDSRISHSSERWNEAPVRNAGNESRRDSKWSSRWGPEDKEKESPPDKKLDADKEKDDSHAEKQPLIGNPRLPSESDSRDKWRPRHRQENRAAPGFGPQRGRGEGSSVGFAPGRGRAKTNVVLPFSSSASTGLIGASPIRTSGILTDTFRYPRGKLLDIYRKQKTLSSFDTKPEGLEEVPCITFSSTVTPLAFLAPEADEEALLEDIWKGKGVDDLGDKTYGEISSSFIEGSSADSGVGESKDKLNSLTSGLDKDDIAPAGSESDVLMDSEEKVIEDVNSDFVKNMKLDCLESSSGFDVSAKLPDDSNLLFDTPFIDSTPKPTKFYQNSVSEVKSLEDDNVSEELSLFYLDPQGVTQGPFLGADIISWFQEGYFGIDLLVCRSDAPEGTPFRPLGEVIPHLALKPGTGPIVSPSEKSEALDSKRSNLEAILPSSDIRDTFPTNGQEWATSKSWSDQASKFVTDEYKFPVQKGNACKILEGRMSKIVYMGMYVKSLFIQVLYTGRPKSRSDSVLENLPNEHKDSSFSSSSHHFIGSEVGEAGLRSHKVSKGNDPNLLGLFWSELEGMHSKGPLSSNTASNLDQWIVNNQQDKFNMIDDTSINPDEWPTDHMRNDHSNVFPDAIDVGRFSRPEAESNRLSLEEYFLSQQLQKQQLQQQQSLSNRNLDFSAQFVEQMRNSALQQRSISPQLPELDHLSKFQFEIEQQKHLRRLQQQQQQQQQLKRLQQQQQQEQLQRLQEQQQLQRLQEQQQLQRLHEQQRLQRLQEEQRLQRLQEEQQRLQRLQEEQRLQRLQEEQQRLQRLQEEQLQQHLQMQMMQQKQQQKQQQLLLDQMLHQQLQDSTFGATCMDPHPMHNVLHQSFLRQRMLNEPQQQSHYIQQHNDATIEQLLQAKFGNNLHHVDHNYMFDVQSLSKHKQTLPFEQQLPLGLQQEQIQARQLAAALRHQPGNEEERHGALWSVDEAGPFIRTTASPHQARSARFGPLDFIQPPQRTLSFEQTSLKQKFQLHEPDTDFVKALTQFQGLDQQEQFSSEVNPYQQRFPKQHTSRNMDAVERVGSNSDEELLKRLTESEELERYIEYQVQRSQLEEEKHRDGVNILVKKRNARSSFVGNDGIYQKSVPQFEQSSGFADGVLTSSYGQNEPSWLFAQPVADKSFKATKDRMGFGDSYAESAFAQGVPVSQEEFANANLGNQGSIRSDGRLTFLSPSETSVDRKHFLSNLDEIQNEEFVNAMSGVGQPVGRDQQQKGSAPIRHSSVGSIGGDGVFHNHEVGDDTSFGGEMNNNRIPTFLSKGISDSLLQHGHDEQVVSSQVVYSDLASTPSIRGKNLTTITSSDESWRETGGPSSNQASEVPSFNKKDPAEPSFIDVLKSTKKPTSEPEASVEPESGAVSKSNKKKGKKGRQIDPSLLGFKVHSNRIMMGEIQRFDD
uniref:GYF domain-containing protein n=1 Tax=Ananas comosus var. bracteatus TaxID=296719 RepID=A0A6V7QTB9_ANACO